MIELKKIILIIVAIFSLLFLFGCNEPSNGSDEPKEKEIIKIEVDTSKISEGVKKEDFSLDLLKLKITYDDNTTKEENVTIDMIPGFDASSLEVGVNSFVLSYEKKKVTFFINIIEDTPKEDVYYQVVFVGMNGDILEELRVKENEYLEEGVSAPIIDGYNFISWSEEFPLLVLQDTIVLANYEKDHRMDDAINYLGEYFENLGVVNDNIALPLNYNGVEMKWDSNDEKRLSSEGKYTKDYETKQVTLTCSLSDGINSSTKRYKVMVSGFKSLNGPIASTYLYRNYDKLTNVFFDTIDIVFCAFVSVDTNGNYKTGSALNNMNSYVIKESHKHGIYVIPSIGGGSSSAADIFSTIASSEATRKNFAKSMVNLINTYGFDGIDIDWEVPKSSEKENYTLLMKELYEAVKANNSHHLVTSAIGGGMWQPPRYDLEHSGKYHDYINVMLYSMCSSSGQYQNALYPSKTKNDSVNGCGYTLVSCSFTESVKIYNDLGIPNSKLILGLAFYGVKQTKTDGAYKSSGSVLYNTLKSNYLNNSNYIYVYDEVAQVPYLISKDGSTFVSYDNPRSIKAKSAYVIETGCAGLMTWEWGCDLSGDLGLAMKEGLGK